MKNKNITKDESPLSRLVSGIYRRKDVEQLKSYINITEGEKEFQELSRTIWEEAKDMDNLPSVSMDEAKKALEYGKIKESRKRIFICSGIAASISILFSIGYFFTNENRYDKDLEIRMAAVKLKPDTANQDIQLIFAENKRIELEGEVANIQYKTNGKVKVNDQDIIDEQPIRDIKYNQLIVPVGKRSILELSDSTVLWINSGSNVIYPATFEKDRREIYVNGEIFLNVHPDKQAPFYVRTKNMDVRVTGTEFNVTAYESDISTSVVLVSGSVQVRTDSKKENDMTPNSRLVYSKKDDSVFTGNVDVTDYISWKDGFYKFKGENLSEILKRLSRYYGVSIHVAPEVSGLICHGRLDLKDDLSRVLNGLKETAPIFVEEIDNNYIISLNQTAYDEKMMKNKESKK